MLKWKLIIKRSAATCHDYWCLWVVDISCKNSLQWGCKAISLIGLPRVLESGETLFLDPKLDQLEIIQRQFQQYTFYLLSFSMLIIMINANQGFCLRWGDTVIQRSVGPDPPPLVGPVLILVVPIHIKLDFQAIFSLIILPKKNKKSGREKLS